MIKKLLTKIAAYIVTHLKGFKIAIAVLMSLAVGISAALLSESRGHVRTLKKEIEHQNVIIDSLLARRMSVMDVQLDVTDKSKVYVFGRKNSGTINVPQQRTYKLLVDSTSVKLK